MIWLIQLKGLMLVLNGWSGNHWGFIDPVRVKIGLSVDKIKYLPGVDKSTQYSS